MSLADSIIGALGGGGVVALARVAGKWIDGRRSRARLDIAAARVEAKREETGTHATERAYDRIERLLDEEREQRKAEREDCRRELDELRGVLDAAIGRRDEQIRELREENADLRRTLMDTVDLVAKQQVEIGRLQDLILSGYVESERPIAAKG